MSSKLRIYQLFLVFVFFLVTSMPNYSFAEKLIINLEQDQRAPFAGILLSPLAYSDLESRALYSEEKFYLELDYKLSLEKAMSQVKYDALVALSEVDRKAKNEILELRQLRINQLSEDLIAAERRSDFMLKFGVVIGVTSTIAVIVLVNQIKE